MTREQENLLLTVARVLRARIKHGIGAWDRGDYMALNDALAPFDPIKSEPINEELR